MNLKKILNLLNMIKLIITLIISSFIKDICCLKYNIQIIQEYQLFKNQLIDYIITLKLSLKI